MGGFLFNHALSGGTGGGLGMLILEKIAINYRKKTKFGMSVFFDENRMSSSMEVYNALLSMHWMLDHMDVGIMFDNKACDHICKNILKVERPSYKNYNNLI